MIIHQSDIHVMNLDVGTREEALIAMAKSLVKQKLVSNHYVEKILERERNHPTGLPIKPYGVAMPHTETEHVLQSQIMFASLKRPVVFQQMDGRGHVNVLFIFMLAMRDANNHLTLLRNLVTKLQNYHYVQALRQVKDVNQLIKWIDEKG
ncbi:PTS sugar transporter subunit IIA [Virgibacillus sp. FSP13]